MTGLPERQVIQLLLVKAVEEHAPTLFTDEALSDAALSALDARDDLELLEKRTAYLWLRLPKTLKGLADAALLPEERIGRWFALAALAGMASNYLGPSGLVHVAYNPLTFLLAWNVVVFATLAARRLRPARVHPCAAGPAVTRPLLVEFYERWIALRTKVVAGRSNVADVGVAGSAFTRAYWEAAAPVVVARLETLVHVAAIGVLTGALAGTYLRGLFFEYNAVWRSTFVFEPSTVAGFLNLLIGPASLLIDGRFLDAQSVSPLLQSAGDLAGTWIHKLALACVLVIAIPRFALVLVAARRARIAARSIHVDFSEAYYRERIAFVREGLGHRLREEIATTLRVEVGKLSESVAVFVRERFFDKVVAPSLVAFRNRGGRVGHLEAELIAATARFEPVLGEHLRLEQKSLQDSLAASVRSIIGRELRGGSDSLASVSTASLSLEQGMTGSVTTGIGDMLGGTVTLAATTAVATLSGGLGKSLGIAVLTHVGVSGPVGLLIGGVVALVAVGGAYVAGRDRVSKSIKDWSIPAFLLSYPLRDARIAEAREETWRQVKRDILERLEPHIPEVTESILRQLPLVVAAAAEADKERA